MNRRLFLSRVSELAALLGIQPLLTACGASTYGPGTKIMTTAGGALMPQSVAGAASTASGYCDTYGSKLETTGITEAHTHTIMIPAAEIASGSVTTVYVTSVYGTHSHPVQLTAADYTALMANESITMSTGPGGDGHTHSLTITCG